MGGKDESCFLQKSVVAKLGPALIAVAVIGAVGFVVFGIVVMNIGNSAHEVRSATVTANWILAGSSQSGVVATGNMTYDADSYLLFDTVLLEETDDYIDVTTPSATFTIPSDGWYVLSAKCRFDASPRSQRYVLSIPGYSNCRGQPDKAPSIGVYCQVLLSESDEIHVKLSTAGRTTNVDTGLCHAAFEKVATKAA